MTRDLPALAANQFDLIVIGGGIYGICAARDAARRGLAVCLLERGDFVGETSSNSLRIIHGGLRYLQHADLRRMRQSICERRLLQRLAPGLVRPLPCLMPTYGHGLRGKAVLRIALAVNDLVGLDRNAGLGPALRLPPGRVISRREVLQLAPELPTAGLTGGAIWYDCQVSSSERLALAFLHSAAAAGVASANYAEVTGFLRDQGGVTGVRVTNRLTGDQFEIRGRAVLNATGPWTDSVLEQLGSGHRPRQFVASKGFNVLLKRRLFEGHAVALAGHVGFRDADALVHKGVQHFFAVPWRRHSLIGTRHLRYAGGADDFAVTGSELDQFLGEVNAAYPGAHLSSDDVLAVYSGMLPEAGAHTGADVRLQKHPTFRDHRDEGWRGLYSVVGVKWTTARYVAQWAVDQIARRMTPAAGPARPESAPLPDAEPAGPDPLLSRDSVRGRDPIAEATIRRLAAYYGPRAEAILQYVDQAPALARPLAPDTEAIGAEVVHAVREESAQRLSDLILRRTDLAADGHPGIHVLAACADLMAAELAWDSTRRQQEIDLAETALRRLHCRPAPRDGAHEVPPESPALRAVTTSGVINA